MAEAQITKEQISAYYDGIINDVRGKVDAGEMGIAEIARESGVPLTTICSMVNRERYGSKIKKTLANFDAIDAAIRKLSEVG